MKAGWGGKGAGYERVTRILSYSYPTVRETERQAWTDYDDEAEVYANTLLSFTRHTLTGLWRLLSARPVAVCW